MVDLTEKSLEEILKEIQQFQEQTGKQLSIQPTKLLVSPDVKSYCDSLGVTPREVFELIMENNNKN
jgi:hydrogenase maturation factor